MSKMIDEVRTYVDMKLNVFEKYFTVTESLRAEMDEFVRDITALGEACTSALEFENRFAEEGLSQRYNSFFPRCVPKQCKMTKAELNQSLLKTGEILNDNKKELMKDAGRLAGILGRKLRKKK